MSLAVSQKVKTYQVWDPVLRINETKEFMVLKGGSQCTYKTITATSFTDSVFNFTAISPSLNTVIDRKIMIKVPVSLNFTCTASVGQPGRFCLQSEYDAFRAHPIASVINNLEAQINTTSVSIQMADVIHPLSRFGGNDRGHTRDYSNFPSFLDTYGTYRSGIASFDNPLGGPGKNVGNNQSPRGAFPMVVTANTPVLANVTATLIEYLNLSPFAFACGAMEPGFIGVQSLDMIFNMSPTLSRMWSHVGNPGGLHPNENTNFAITGGHAPNNSFFAAPSLLVRYITPQIGQPIPAICQTPLFKVQRYKTVQTLAMPYLGTHGFTTTNNIQLTEVPRRMYVYCRKSNPTFEDTDSYLGITNVNINYANRTGRLSSAREIQLYHMSLKNGYNGKWADWTGGAVHITGANAPEPKAGFGAVLAIEFGTDIALAPGFATSVSSNQNLQMDVTVKNTSGVAIAGQYELVILTVSEGIFTIRNNTAIPQTAVLSPMDVINSANAPMVDYNEIRLAYGSSFWDGVKHFFGRIWQGIKGVVKNAPRIANTVGNVATALAPIIGVGQNGLPVVSYRKKPKKRRRKKRGGVSVGGGGSNMSTAQLKQLLNKI